MTASATVAILSYLRFKKRWHYIATEVDVPGGARADVLASDGKSLVEFEIKTNIADIRRDFANKVEKHEIYACAPLEILDEDTMRKGSLIVRVEDDYRGYTIRKYRNSIDPANRLSLWASGWKTKEGARQNLEKNLPTDKGVPNQLVYLVHRDVAEKGIDLIPEQYGVTSFSDHNYHAVSVLRKPKVLHRNPVSQETLNKLLARMSSELANLHAGAIAWNAYRHVLASVRDDLDREAELDSLLVSQNETPKPE